MGMPEQLPKSEQIQQLWELAKRSGALGDWAASYFAYNELHRLIPSEYTLVMRAEASRLLGLIDVSGFPTELEMGSIQRVLKEEGGALLARWIAAQDSDCDLIELHQIDGVESDLVRRAIARHVLAHNMSANLGLHNFERLEASPIAESEKFKHHIIFPEYTLDATDSVQILSKTRDSQRKALVSACKITEVLDATLFIESELICSEGEYFADATLRDEAEFHDPQHDTVILASSKRSLIVTKSFENSRSVVHLEKAFWLAYPTSFAWGHWFNEVLMRCAVMAKHKEFQRIPCIVSKSVPSSFVQFAQFLFPEANFLTIEQGTKCVLDVAYVVPSRISHPSHEFWSLAGDMNRLHAEPEVSGLLRNRIRARATVPSTFEHQEIFLSRKGAKYRVGAVETLLAQYAHRAHFAVVDPGALSPQDQVNMAVYCTRVFGEGGSNWDLVSTAATHGCRALMIHHDRHFEWNGLHQVLRENIGRENLVIVNGNRIPLPIGYGEKQSHMPNFLNEPETREIAAWLDL